MDYRGTFENGVVRPDQPLDLPNGTPVEFHAIAKAKGRGRSERRDIADADRLARSRRTIEDVVREQGVRPVNSLDELGGEWPDEGDDVDEFIRSMKESRR